MKTSTLSKAWAFSCAQFAMLLISTVKMILLGIPIVAILVSLYVSGGDLSGWRYRVVIGYLLTVTFTGTGWLMTTIWKQNNEKLKFHVLVNGLNRFSYYVGTFIIPSIYFICLATITAFSLNFKINVGLDLRGAVVDLSWLIGCTAGAVALYTVIGQNSNTIKTANIAAQLVNFCLIGSMFSPTVFKTEYGQYVSDAVSLNPLTLLIAREYTEHPDYMLIFRSCIDLDRWLIMSASASVFWILLVVYSEWLQVSQDHRRPFHYIFTCWFTNRKSSKVYAGEGYQPDPKMIEVSSIETAPDSSKVVIDQVTKIYDGSTYKAVDNVTLSFGTGEIFGLIGFNGAGKSTLISMITGIIDPSMGKIRIFGKDSQADWKNIVGTVGFCPQFNVFFGDLTVEQNFYYFGRMKGMNSIEILETTSMFCDALGLGAHLKHIASTLSGGQKRKLCLAIAYLGSPDLVVLDESTSGVDPESRRLMWSFMQTFKSKTATILCTHFMDEADFLADRKAMMTQGKVICVGTSHHFKNVFDTGYILSLETSERFETDKVTAWLNRNQIDVFKNRKVHSIAEFYCSKSLLSHLSEFERDMDMKGMYDSYSIKENGLIAIFESSSLLTNGKGLNENESEELIKLQGLMVKGSPVSSTIHLITYMLRRFVSDFGTYAIQLIPFMLSFLNSIYACSYIQEEFRRAVIPPGGSDLRIPVSQFLVCTFFSQLIYAVMPLLADEFFIVRSQYCSFFLSAGVPLAGFWVAVVAKTAVFLAFPMSCIIFLNSSVLPRSFDLIGVAHYTTLEVVVISLSISSFVLMLSRTIGSNVRNVVTTFQMLPLISAGMAVFVFKSSSAGEHSTAAIISKCLVFINPLLSWSLNNLHWHPNLANPLITGSAHFTINILIVVVLECRYLFRKRTRLPEDPQRAVEYTNANVVYGWLKPFHAVKNLNLLIVKTEVMALLGTNGSGKTSALKVLVDEVSPARGSAHIGDLDTMADRYECIANVAWCPQSDNILIHSLTVRDHMEIMCKINGMPDDKMARYTELITRSMGIEDFVDSQVATLSGGTQRKLCAILAIMLPRRVVVLDEPTSSLDPQARKKLWASVRQLNGHRTTIVTTHYMSEVSECDRSAFLIKGELKAVGTEHELIKLDPLAATVYKVILSFAVTQEIPSDVVKFTNQYILQSTKGTSCSFDQSVSRNVYLSINVPPSQLVQVVENLLGQQSTGNIKDFSIGKTTIENIFLDMCHKVETGAQA